MLYTFKLGSDVCQLFLNKTGGGEVEDILGHVMSVMSFFLA